MRKKAFKVSSITKLSDLKIGDSFSESDLALQDDGYVVQFKHMTKYSRSRITVKPGTHQMTMSNSGVKLAPIDFSKKRILMEMINTQTILDEAHKFFSKLDIYKELEIQPKRGILLYSGPGEGKSSTISVFCKQAVEEDPGTVVIVWPTSKVDADSVQEFLTANSKYSAAATRLILIMEDIGGGNKEGSGPRSVDSGILNMLDGVGETFKLPTFIVATTNTPEQLLASLSDRPGRFDAFIELKSPGPSERLKLFEFISKRNASEEEKSIITSDKTNGLSAAHITEIVIRHRLTDKPVTEVIKEITEHSKKVQNQFQKETKMGFDDF
jgi:SpoVK/Ycf46/Vps4 family AAA+-type ATPase